MMVVLFGPIGWVETVIVSDRRFHACTDQKLADLCTTVPCRQMKASETRFILYCGVTSILYEELAGIIKVLFNCLVERRVLAYFMIFLEVWICTILQQ